MSCVVLLCGSATALAQDAAAVRAEVEGRLARHAAAVGKHDVATALDLYAEDAVVRPANMEPVRGKAALRDFFTGWFKAMTIKDASYATDELDVCGDKAFHIGTYKGMVVLPDVPPIADRGSFNIVWKRQADGSWRYHRGIFNSSLQAADTVTRKK
jgi:ketosteroid isomerase-like protein